MVQSQSRPYQPVGACRELLLCKDNEVLIAGPAGTGKSRACLEKINLCCYKYPKARVLIVRKTRESLTNTGLVTFEEKVLPEKSAVLFGPKRSHRQIYKYPNGSEIILGGMDDAQKVMSSEYDLIYCQEATEIEEEDWEKLSTRLRNNKMPYQQMIADCNPDSPTHWLKLREQRGLLRIIESTHEDNPTLWDTQIGDWTDEGKIYIERLGNLTGVTRDRLLWGKWVAAEGARWPFVQAKTHLFKFSERFPYGLPPDARIYMGVDFGYAAPFCALWIYVDPEKNLWVIRELYETRVPADLQPRRILLNTPPGEHISSIYMDSSMWDRQSQAMPTASNDSVFDLYRGVLSSDARFGPIVKGFKGDRKFPLGTLDRYLAHDNGHPNLYIEEGCQGLWKEVTNAVWHRHGKEDIDDDCADHAITALYYMAHTRHRESREEVLTPHKFIEVMSNDRDRLRDRIYREKSRKFAAENRRRFYGR